MPLLTRLADRAQVVSRRRKAAWIVRHLDHLGARRLLFVGATGTTGRREFEHLVERVVATGRELVVWSSLQPAGEAPYVRASGLDLPFASGAFDAVISNAVIEHVGDTAAQARFLAEHRRVAPHWVITTPNRWFPIESHHRVVLRHWSRRWRDAPERLFTRLLSRRELRALGVDHVRGRWWSPTFTAWGDGH